LVLVFVLVCPFCFWIWFLAFSVFTFRFRFRFRFGFSFGFGLGFSFTLDFVWLFVMHIFAIDSFFLFFVVLSWFTFLTALRVHSFIPSSTWSLRRRNTNTPSVRSWQVPSLAVGQWSRTTSWDLRTSIYSHSRNTWKCSTRKVMFQFIYLLI
jgi:hypothetical protein